MTLTPQLQALVKRRESPVVQLLGELYPAQSHTLDAEQERVMEDFGKLYRAGTPEEQQILRSAVSDFIMEAMMCCLRISFTPVGVAPTAKTGNSGTTPELRALLERQRG